MSRMGLMVAGLIGIVALVAVALEINPGEVWAWLPDPVQTVLAVTGAVLAVLVILALTLGGTPRRPRPR